MTREEWIAFPDHFSVTSIVSIQSRKDNAVLFLHTATDYTAILSGFVWHAFSVFAIITSRRIIKNARYTGMSFKLM